MKGRRIKHISFLVKNQLLNGEYKAGIDGAEQVFNLNNSRKPVLIHQKAIDHCEVSGGGVSLQIKEKADGYIQNAVMTLFTRDFWQKFPQAFECIKNSTIYRQWFGGNIKTPAHFDTLVGTTKKRLLDENIHKLLHWHQGPYLANDIPKSDDPQNPEWANKFYSLMAGDEGAGEEFIEYTDYADMQGITIHDDIAVHAGNVNAAQYANVWNENPVGHCDPDYIETTQVADFAAKGTDFSRIENFMEDSVLSYTDPARFEDYGRFVYGESHRNILPVFNRPSMHRLFLASYYCAGETYWRMRMRGGGNKILKLARRNTERYRSVVQISYDERKGGTDISETQWHDPGRFWYRGLWWGNIRTGVPGAPPRASESGHGDWASIWGRVPDPDSLRWSWILDGNRYHKEGYELWYRFAKLVILQGDINPSNARLFNKTLVYTTNAYDYFLNHPVSSFADTIGYGGINLRDHIIRGTNMLLSLPLNEITAGPLWQPEWLKNLTEFFTTYYVAGTGEESKESLIARVLHFAVTNYRSNFYSDQSTLDMASLLVDIYRNEKYPFYFDYFPTEVTLDDIRLSDHLFWISKRADELYKGDDPEFEKWKNFGIGDGELGDSYLKLLWGAFMKRLRQLNIDDSLTREYTFYGHYPTASECRHPFHPQTLRTCYGNEYLVLKNNPARLDFAFKLTPERSINREIWLVAPAKHRENLVRLQTPHTNPTGTKFIPLIGSNTSAPDNPITEDSYGAGTGVRKPLAHYTDTSGTEYSFDTFSPLHIVDEKVLVYSWDHGTSIRSATGFEKYTAIDSYYVKDSNGKIVAEKGIYRIFMAGSSAYPGLTQTHLPEAMILRPIVISENIIYYRFFNSNLCFKNIDNHDVTLQFTISVENATLATRTMYGTFACIYISKLGQSFYLPYRGIGYGQPLPGEVIKITLVPGETMQVKTTMIYSNNNCIKMNFDGLLLCAKSVGDIAAFEPYSAELRENYYGL